MMIMKNTCLTFLTSLILAATALILPTKSSAGVFDEIGQVAGDFFKNNPTNTWDVSAYALNNLTSSKLDVSKGWGAGARVGYWLSPSVGASIDLSYCDSSWTFASLGIAARGTINLGNFGTLSPYATAGPGYTFTRSADGVTQQIIAKAGGGARLHINALKWFDMFGEYSHTTTKPKEQDLVMVGFIKSF